LGLYGGVLVWSIVLFKTKLFDWTVFNVQPNWRLIVGNQVVYNELPDDDNDRTKMFEMQSLREIGSGLHGHWPTEVVFDSVDLRKEVVLVSDGGSLQCYTQDEIPLEITWQTILTPLSGYLINLSRQGEDAAIKYFRGRFETYITNWVKTKPEKIVFDCLANLEEEFKNLFGGPLNVDDTEMEYGLFTGTPQITRVKRSKRFQDAAEGRRISEIVGGSVLELTKHFGDKKPDPNLVMMASAAASQVPIEGVFLIPDIGKAGKGAQGLFAAAAAMNKKTSNQPKKDQQ
jgi:hypothetical protein